MAWTSIPDYVLEQIASSSLANVLLANQRYLAETILGMHHGDEFARFLKLNNGGTDGGAIYFQGATTNFIKCNAAGTLLTSVLPWNVETPSVINGDTVCLFFNGAESFTSDFYLGGRHATNYMGWYAPYEGSILSLSCQIFNVNAATQTIQGEVHVNGSNVLATSGMSMTTLSQITDAEVSQARGVDTFSVGDYIDVFMNYTSGGNVIRVGAWVEVVLNTGKTD